jgi:drug/metabolite transporter (DMT)-like permease
MSRPLDAVAAVLVVMLCFSWGFNQVAVKLALPDVPPLIQATIRSVVAAILIAIWMRLRGLSFSLRDGSLVPGLAAGFFFGIEFILIFRGLLYTTATRAVLFIYLAPFFVVLGARFFLPGDRFSLWQWLGLGLSFAGMLVAFGLPTPAADPRQVVGDVMMVGAALTWAITTLIIKGSALNRVPGEKTLLYQIVVSGVMIGIGVPLFGETMRAMPGAVAIGSLAYQSLWVLTITFALWFGLMRRYSASRLSAFTFLTPLFGVAAGHLVLGEPLTPAFAAAVALVAVGLILVNRRN